ncbi:hypothetical protein GIB67_027984 [Kingdonia uniflora]|uniref:Large ribosomal subunit protein bL31c n=1 Tax=Kingdonia uniflora TaxID=39325 RepID=A0A7J7NW94_9MAGN|nr:hypothetical protein GIB67_027984 [Kingdonia uniflora]
MGANIEQPFHPNKNLSLHPSNQGYRKFFKAWFSRPQWSCRKKEIHPEFFEDAKVYCNGEQVMTTGGTRKEYVVDVWSGTIHFIWVIGRHCLSMPIKSKKLGEVWRVTRLMTIPNLKGEIIIHPKKKSGTGKREEVKCTT